MELYLFGARDLPPALTSRITTALTAAPPHSVILPSNMVFPHSLVVTVGLRTLGVEPLFYRLMWGAEGALTGYGTLDPTTKVFCHDLVADYLRALNVPRVVQADDAHVVEATIEGIVHKCRNTTQAFDPYMPVSSWASVVEYLAQNPESYAAQNLITPRTTVVNGGARLHLAGDCTTVVT